MDHRASLLNAMPHLRHDKPTTNAPSQLHSPYGLPITDHFVGCNFRKGDFFCRAIFEDTDWSHPDAVHS